MRDLCKARLVKYLRSPIFWLAAIVSLVSGIHNGIYCGYSKDEIGEIAQCRVDDVWFLIAIWAAIICTALGIGREFSDGTIRNKVIAGYTKAQIFFAEILVTTLTTFLLYLLNIVPTAVGGWYFLSAFPMLYAVEWFLNLFLIFALMNLFAVTLTYLIGRRAVGVVAAFVLQFALYIMAGMTDGYYYNIGEPQIMTSMYYAENSDGSITEVKGEVENGYYIEGLQLTLVKLEHAVNPMYGMIDMVSFGIVQDASQVEDYVLVQAENKIRDIHFDVFKMLVYCIGVTAGGTYLFRKKDLK